MIRTIAKEIREYKVDQLKFKPRKKKGKGGGEKHGGDTPDAELKQLEALEKKEGKSKLDDTDTVTVKHTWRQEGTIMLRDDERIDDLQRNHYGIIQRKGAFCFGMDAILLSSFATVKKNETALDLGSGTGILPILLEAKNEGAHYTGLEIQEESADMARRSV